MAGKIKALIERIVAERSQGDPVLAVTTRTKILLKGVDPDRYTPTSDDDARVLEDLRAIAREMGITRI